MRIKYKLYGYEEGEDFFINGIPLPMYLHYLKERRHFNKEIVVSHTKKYYDIDLTDQLDDYIWSFKFNIYDKHRESFKKRKTDDGSRKYFDTYARDEYYSFMDTTFFDEEDCLTYFFNHTEIHHIHPLVYGGKSNMENLIHLNSFNHDLLHLNPLESEEKYCHQAVDYLGYLYTELGLRMIIQKYELAKYDDRMFFSFFTTCIKQEMRNFYDYILEESNRTNTGTTIHDIEVMRCKQPQR
ncbi:HNH endonuclease [Bacillus infantis]|uniref:HNH endonuclease n=1 Tax=Bacillus infantis TaxID=324767 RepID=UPI003CF5C378